MGGMSGTYALCWLNGRTMRTEEARIDPDDRGFLLGDGVFETVLLRRGQAVWWQEHVQRLRHGAQVLGMTPPDVDVLSNAFGEIVAANNLDNVDESVLRITFSRGSGGRGLSAGAGKEATLLLRASAMAASSDVARAMIVESVRRNGSSVSSRLKTLSYVDGVLAQREAEAQRFSEALLRNDIGRLICGARANLFVWRNAELWTPPIEEGCLPGIARGYLLDIARNTGIVCREESLEDLRADDCVLLTNSLRGVVVLAEVGGVALRPADKCGDLTALLSAFRKRMA